MQLLRELITINKNFQTAVNLRLDREDAQKLLGYIPTSASTALLKQFFRNISERRGKNAALLIGPYGKGKTHLLLVLLALLERRCPAECRQVLQRICNVDESCGELAERVMKKGFFLTVLVSDNGGSVNTAFLLALWEALERQGLEELMPDSYYAEAVQTINRWKKEFPETYGKLNSLLRENGKYAGEQGRGKNGEEPAERLCLALCAFDEKALTLFQELYPQLTAGSRFQPLINMEAAVLYQKVNRKLCKEHGYQGIYVVFDEFSKYLEGYSRVGSGADMKTLQDMCELANGALEDSFFITFVAHKSLREYGSRIQKELQNQFRGIEGRLQEYLFVASARNNFDLIGSVLQKTEKFNREYEGFFKQKYVEELLEKTYELPVFRTQFSFPEYVLTVVRGCFPLTPMAAVLLLNLSEKAAQNERTLFTFLAGDEPNSLYRLTYGKQKAAARYVGADLIYDYFTPTLREMTDLPELHNEWLKAEYALKQVEQETETKLIKAMAILHIAGNRQEMPVNCRNIALAEGESETLTEERLAKLIEKKLLIWRSRLGCYAFQNNVCVNLEEALREAMGRLPARLDVPKRLAAISELEYVLPKSYNQTFVITRYFQYVYMTPELLAQTSETSYLFQEAFSDGKLIALVSEEALDETLVLERSRLWHDSRVLILLPDRGFRQEEKIRRLLAAQELLGDEGFLEDNKVLEQELKLFIEDLYFEINAVLEADFLPQNGGCRVIWNGEARRFASEKEFNAFLSGICGEYYHLTPRVNHELLNIRNVTGQYLKARNHVVDAILLEKSMEEYEKGTSPEAMIYRTAFVRTGFSGSRFPQDLGTVHILGEIRQFIQNCTGSKGSFEELYEKLLGKGYGARKGILPLFLAAELRNVAGTPVLYLQTKEVCCNAEALNNINDRPERYFLYLETEDGEKEVFLEELEHFFGAAHGSAGKQERIRCLVSEMQKSYRALPKVASNWKQFVPAEWKDALSHYTDKFEVRWEEKDALRLYEASEKLMGILRKLEINPREVLFEKIPLFLGRQQCDIMCARAVEIIFWVWRNRLSAIESSLAKKCLTLWGGAEGESLVSYLKGWYNRQRDGIQNLILGTNASALRSCIEAISSYDEKELVAELAFALTDVHIEDWIWDTQKAFWNGLTAAKEEMEEGSAAAVRHSSKKVMFTDREGRLLERYFQPEESGIGVFLKNAISEALEEFGDSMEPAQKAAVLVEALEELLK